LRSISFEVGLHLAVVVGIEKKRITT